MLDEARTLMEPSRRAAVAVRSAKDALIRTRRAANGDLEDEDLRDALSTVRRAVSTCEQSQRRVMGARTLAAAKAAAADCERAAREARAAAP